MEARGLAARSQRPLYHASISPEPGTPLKHDQITQAVDRLEERLGLHGQPRLVVVHRKKQREHVHVVWSRIDAENGVSIPYSWNYRLHEQTARELEVLFGHRVVSGSHALAHKALRAPRSPEEYEERQAARSGIPLAQVTDEITALWNASPSSESFQRRLEEAGYTLARGDRRVFVVIDRAGEVHSLARRIRGANTAAVRARLASVDAHELPSVGEARKTIRSAKQRTDEVARFTRASVEVARRVGELSERIPVPPRKDHDARRAFAEIVRPHDAAAPSRPLRMTRKRVASNSYRSARALLVAEYASKIGAARCHAPRDELDAILAALYAEREAALAALRRDFKGEASSAGRLRTLARILPRPGPSRRKRRISIRQRL